MENLNRVMRFRELEMASEEEKNEIISNIIKTRNAALGDDSLKRWCVKSILTNYTYFLKQPVDVFRYLPDTLVQEVFKVMQEYRYHPETIGHEALQSKEFLRKLINPQVTSVCKLFKQFCLFFNESKPELHEEYLYWMMQNCPHIREITIFADYESRRDFHLSYMSHENYYAGNQFKSDDSESEYEVRDYVQPLLQVSGLNMSLWKSLRSLVLIGIYMTDTCIGQFLPNHPILQHLEFRITDSFTMVGVDALSKMQKLTNLSIVIGSQPKSSKNRIASTILVHAAGRVPNLKKFDMGVRNAPLKAFVVEYARCYPHKLLTLRWARLYNSTYELDWPTCLSVDQMETFIEPEFLSKIGKAPVVKEIKFRGLNKIRLSYIYRVVDALGSELLKLSFEYPTVETQWDILDFERLLSACPNLEELECYGRSRYGDDYTKPKVQMPSSTFSPSLFRKIKRLRYRAESYESDHKVLEMVFKAYYAGSESFSSDHKRLKIKTDFEIMAMHQVLLEYPNRLMDCWHFVLLDPQCEEKLEIALDIAAMMTLRSSHFMSVTVGSDPWPSARDVAAHSIWFRNFASKAGISFSFLLYKVPYYAGQDWW